MHSDDTIEHNKSIDSASATSRSPLRRWRCHGAGAIRMALTLPRKAEQMALCLAAAAMGLLVGCAYCLAQPRAPGTSTIPLLGLAVIFLGETITPYFHPFAAGLLLGLVYDTMEDEWYGPAVARSVRRSFRAQGS